MVDQAVEVALKMPNVSGGTGNTPVVSPSQGNNGGAVLLILRGILVLHLAVVGAQEQRERLLLEIRVVLVVMAQHLLFLVRLFIMLAEVEGVVTMDQLHL
jgi:hypothetical protein